MVPNQARLLENVASVFVKHISTYYAESYDNEKCVLLILLAFAAFLYLLHRLKEQTVS